MKKLTFFLFILLVLQACYVTRVTHSEAIDYIMESTKEQVIGTFGLPTSKQVEGEYEQWIYNFGGGTVNIPLSSSSTSNVTVNPYANSATVNTYNYGGASVSRTYSKYLRLVFKDGIVVGCDPHNVDLTYREMDKGLTWGLGTVFLLAYFIAMFSLM